MKTFKEYLNEGKMLKNRDEAIKILRNIIKDHQFAEADGVKIDVQTANAIITIYDQLKKSKENYKKFHVSKMAEIAWSIIRK